jgi:adenylate kinase family enzyme
MKTSRVHIMGASGSGATTLGRAVADALASPNHDTDDYYWLPTTPPYRDRRELADRLRLMHELFLGRDKWVLSGSLDNWGAAIVPFFDLVVFLTVARDMRLKRLRDREARLYGETEILPGGKRNQETEEFIEWASHYEDGTRGGRSLPRHEAWLATLPCPVIRLDGARERASLVTEVLRALPR